MEYLEEAAHKLFEKLERDLQKAAVMEGENLESFEDAAFDLFFETQEELINLISENLSEFIDSRKDLSSVPPILKCKNIEELNVIISQNLEVYPFIIQFTESESMDTFNWQPLYVALRDYFDEDVIAAISSQYEFDLAKEAFLGILDISTNFRANAEYEDFSFNVDALRQCRFANPDDEIALESLFQELTPPVSAPMIPTEKVYVGSTGGLEPRFIEWLERHYKAGTLFDDEDLDFDAPEPEKDPDWENLLASWLETDSWQETSFEHYLWIPIDFRAPIDYEYGEVPIFFEIHQLSQIMREPNNSRISHLPESLEHYKIVMYRTGERHEYNGEMDRSLLALQVLLFHESSNVPIDKIEAEVDWIRLKEKAYPLLGLSRDELEEISQTYLRAQ